MVHQRTLFFKRLEVIEPMLAFISHRMSGGMELRARLERAEIDLVVA